MNRSVPLFIDPFLSSQVWSIPQAPLTKLLSIIHLGFSHLQGGFRCVCVREREGRKRGERERGGEKLGDGGRD